MTNSIIVILTNHCHAYFYRGAAAAVNDGYSTYLLIQWNIIAAVIQTESLEAKILTWPEEIVGHCKHNPLKRCDVEPVLIPTELNFDEETR